MKPTFNPLDHPICFTRPLWLYHLPGWVEHVPFGMLMIDLARPKILVELGTHIGVSYCAFCQAVKQLGLDTHCYAVDTWKGDPQTTFYGPEILAELRAHHDPLYGEFSRLIQSTFDEGVNYFTDGSIDLLHIDGFHTYEAVKHDFETWLPKLSQHAVVLFHDTNVRERDFGVWKLWRELQQKYSSFEFFHGYGLGVLRVGEKSTPALQPLFTMSADQSKRTREFFFALGSHYSIQVGQDQGIKGLANQITVKEQSCQALTDSDGGAGAIDSGASDPGGREGAILSSAEDRGGGEGTILSSAEGRGGGSCANGAGADEAGGGTRAKDRLVERPAREKHRRQRNPNQNTGSLRSELSNGERVASRQSSGTGSRHPFTPYADPGNLQRHLLETGPMDAQGAPVSCARRQPAGKILVAGDSCAAGIKERRIGSVRPKNNPKVARPGSLVPSAGSHPIQSTPPGKYRGAAFHPGSSGRGAKVFCRL